MKLSRFFGRITEDQEALTREFIHLYWEPPEADDLILGKDGTQTAVFDGEHWREFNFPGLSAGLSA